MTALAQSTASQNLAQHRVLHQLLDANRDFALMARGTTHHLPMALSALAAMGADDAHLQDWYAAWARNYALPLEAGTLPPAQQEALARGDWLALRTERDAWPALRDFFAARIARQGCVPVLQEVWAQLPPAPASSAFHAWIRLHYGLSCMHAGEVAAALAMLVVSHLPLSFKPGTAASPASDTGTALSHIAQALPAWQHPARWITERLQAVAAEPQLQAAMLAPPSLPAAQLLQQMAHAALLLYWQNRNFTVLHMITGLHAARGIFTHLSPSQVAAGMPALWDAFCVAYASVGAPPLPGAPDLPALTEHADKNWDRLLQLACAAEDEHVIKLSHACHAENQAYPHPLYYAVVARLLRAGD